MDRVKTKRSTRIIGILIVLAFSIFAPFLNPTTVLATTPIRLHWFERATFQVSGGLYLDSNFTLDTDASTDSTYFYNGTLKYVSSSNNRCESGSGMVITVKASSLQNTSNDTPVESVSYATFDKCNDTETDAFRDAARAGSMKITDAFNLTESYRWINQNTISVDAGHFKGKAIEFTNNSAGQHISFGGTATMETGCKLTLSISDINPDGTRATVNPSASASDGSDNNDCSAAITSLFKNKSITLKDAANRSKIADTPVTRSAVVSSHPKSDMQAGDSISAAPQTDSISLIKSGAPYPFIAQDANATGGGGFLNYSTTFDNVDPGDYLACSTVADNCVSFTKILGQGVSIIIEGKNDSIAIHGVGIGGNTTVQCQGSFAVKWIVCPFFESINSMISKVFKDYVMPLLAVNPLTTNSAIYPVWVNFRNVTNVVFVLLFLVIIFSNAISGLDAYTVKKALPRLVAAAVLVQISFFVCGIIIDVGNVLGYGVAGLVNGTILGNGITTNASGVQNVAGGVGLVLVGGLGAILAVAAELWVFLLPIALAAGISIVTFVLTLVMRQLVLDILIVLSPLAFVAWVLPNTESLFKKWWQNLFKLVMMYPMVVLLMTMSSVLAKVAGAGNTAGTSQAIIAMMAPIVALIAAPATFKMGGSVMGKVAGAVQQRGKAAQGKVRNAQLFKDMQAGRKERGLLQSQDPNAKFGKVGRYLGAVKSGSLIPAGKAAQRRLNAGYVAAQDARRKDAMAELVNKGIEGDNKTASELYKTAIGDTFTTRDGKKIKVTQEHKDAALESIAKNNGIPELVDIYNDSLGLRDLKEKVDAGTATDSERTTYQERLREWNRGIASNRSAIIGAAPHLVHGKGMRVYDELPAKNIVGMNDAAVEDLMSRSNATTGSQKARVNLANAVATIGQDSFLRAEAKQGLLRQIYEEVETNGALASTKIEALGGMTMREYRDTYMSKAGSGTDATYSMQAVPDKVEATTDSSGDSGGDSASEGGDDDGGTDGGGGSTPPPDGDSSGPGGSSAPDSRPVYGPPEPGVDAKATPAPVDTRPIHGPEVPPPTIEEQAQQMEVRQKQRAADADKQLSEQLDASVAQARSNLGLDDDVRPVYGPPAPTPEAPTPPPAPQVVEPRPVVGRSYPNAIDANSTEVTPRVVPGQVIPPNNPRPPETPEE